MENFESSVQMLIAVGAMMIAGFALLYHYQLHREVSGIRIYAKEKLNWNNFAWIMGAAFILKLIIAAKYEGHGTDMNCFSAWSDMIFKDGPWEFYHSDAFTDYPPGYMSLLWIVGALRSVFGFDMATASGRILIKLFPILFDVGAGALLYKIAKRKFSEVSSQLLAVTYVINPIIVLDSSAWGQVDAAVTFFVLLVGYLCMEQKRIPAYFAFVVGVLIKPQMVMFAPILIWTIIEQVFLKDFNTKKMIRDLVGGLSAIAAMFIFMLPFGVDKVLIQYVNTLGSYPYCTINAYNFWGLLGLNWQPQTIEFLGIQASTWGTLTIFVSVGLSALIFFKLKEDKSRYFLSMAVLIANMFLFSVRMHERYLFPIVVLLIAAFLMKPTKQLFATYVGFSVVHFLNVGHVLWAYIEESGNTAPNGSLVGLTSVATLLIFAYMFYAIFSKSTMQDLEEQKGRKKNSPKYIQKNPTEEPKKSWKEYVLHIHASKKMKPFTKLDWIILLGIIVLYSAFAFYDLGNMSAPETSWTATKDNKTIMLDLGEDRDISMIYTYLGVKENRNFMLEIAKDGQNFENKGTVRATSVFCWDPLKTWNEETQEEGGQTYDWQEKYRYIRLTATDDLENETTMLNEIVVLDKDGNAIEPVNKGEYANLFDEQFCFEPHENLPQTEWKAEKEGTSLTIDLGRDYNISMLHAYTKQKANQKLKLEVAKHTENDIVYIMLGEVVSGDADGWSNLYQAGSEENTYRFAADSYRYIRLTTTQKDTTFDEIVVTNQADQVIPIVDYENGDNLFDEQDAYKKPITFRSGTYFDEIYHAKTAYEMIHGISNYEWTHPPLGKVFISMGIRAFGMNPFGWRVVGVLFGIAMLPFMYLFARRLFGEKTWPAGALTFLFAFDFMHFTQTRISTIDVYGTFFIIAMYFFMYWYSQTSFYDTKLWKTFIPLGLSALMMGLGCASKWTAVYASAGLAIFFFVIMGYRAYEFYLAKKDPNGTTEGISHQHIINVFRKKLIQTILFCVLFFVVIAGAIYLCSYIPFEDGASVSGGYNAQRFLGTDWDETPVASLVQTLRDHSGEPFWELVGKMLNNQKAMYTYHHDLTASHPFSAAWYEWPTMNRPMYYFSQTMNDGLKQGISAFGNPLVWWAGIPALLFITCPLAFGDKRKWNKKLGSITTQWVQWASCIFFMFMALYALVLRQTKYVDVTEGDLFSQWGWYGNPLIFLGIISFVFLCVQMFSRGDRIAVFMIFAYAVQFLPWVLVPRCTFAYHYFPSVPFIAMMIIYAMVKITECNKKWLKWCFVYLAVAFLLFLLFYPVLSGQSILDGFARDGLRWMKNWQLIS